MVHTLQRFVCWVRTEMPTCVSETVLCVGIHREIGIPAVPLAGTATLAIHLSRLRLPPAKHLPFSRCTIQAAARAFSCNRYNDAQLWGKGQRTVRLRD